MPSNQAAIRDRNRLRIDQSSIRDGFCRRRFPLTKILFTHDRFLSTRWWPLTETVNGNCLVWHPL